MSGDTSKEIGDLENELGDILFEIECCEDRLVELRGDKILIEAELRKISLMSKTDKGR